MTTGEEDEETVATARAKLYSLAVNQIWKERGTGTIKVNVHKSNKSSRLGMCDTSKVEDAYALVMRLDAVLKLILYVKLFPGMQCNLEQDRFIRVVAMESDGLSHFAIKFANANDATAFLTSLQEHIPSA